MALSPSSFEAEISVEDNVGFRLLEQRVEHIQSDVSEMKTDMRRLETKIESTRDTTAEVKDSVAALRVEMKEGFAASNQKYTELAAAITVLDAKFERNYERLDRKLDQKFDVLHVKTDALDQKLDQKFDVLDAKTDALEKKFDHKLVAIDRKIDEAKEDLMARVDALFDRKFFRAMSVFVGAVPPMFVLTSMAEKMSLGTYSMLAIAIAVPAVLITGAFLATRTSR